MWFKTLLRIPWREHEQRERFKENREKDTFTHNQKDTVVISKVHHKGMRAWSI